YNQIVRTVANQEHNTEADNARLFALVNIAMADAGLVCWNRKYDDDFWRPILGIRDGASDGNPLTDGDPTWTALGAQVSDPRPGETNFTPNFPSYTSGHATFGAAAFKMLERFYNTDNITFTFISDEFNGITRGADGMVRPVVARTFHSFSEAAEENGQSRIYLGIHWAFDKTEGILCGDHVADYVFDNFLHPRTQGGRAAPGPAAPAAGRTFDVSSASNGAGSALAPLLLGQRSAPVTPAPVSRDLTLEQPSRVPEAWQTVVAPASSATSAQTYDGVRNVAPVDGGSLHAPLGTDWFGVF